MTSKIFRDNLLAGQVALVTGGGTGIGAAVARELGHLGATVCIASRKEAHIAPAAAGLSEELGREVTGLTVDIRDEGSTAELAKEIVARHGRLDILVNNGGGQFLAPAATISEKGWRAVVDTNLTGTWHMTRAAAVAWMLEHGGTVVSITMLTRRSFPGMAHSVAARAGVEAMTRTLAVEWAPMGIRLNCVAPGYIASSGMKRYPVGPEFFVELQKAVPMKRLGTCEEVAWAVAYLASPASAYVTGEVVTVDGGKTLWGDFWEVPDPKELPEVVIPTEPWEEG